MVNNKQIVAVAATLFAQEALAVNIHRHHNNIHKRDVYIETDVVVVTDWTTVTVYEDFSSTTSTSTTPSATSTYVAPTTSTTPVAVPTTTSTSSTPSTTSTFYTVTTSAAAAPSSSAVASSSAKVEQAAAAIEDVTSSSAVAAPSTSSTSAAAVAATAASSSSSSTGRRGLAYNTGSLLENFLGSGTQVGWSYNWGATADSEAPSGLEYVPMLWGPDKTSGWSSAAETAIANGAQYFLSFNECDNAGQCNTDAATAASAHQTYLNPYSDSVKIGTPAITNSQNAGEGVDWLTAFLEACDGACAYDFCPLHWYNSPDTNDFLTHITKVYEACGKNVWITEFAPTGSDDEINTFLVDVMDQLDNNATYSFVDRYAYFWAATGSLLTSETTLSEYGNTYAYN